MLILSRYLKAVILTTYLCSLSHLVETRHMSDSEDQHLEPRLDTRLSSLPSAADRPPNNTSHHHKHRHKHNINNVNNSEFSNNLSDKDIHQDNNLLLRPSNNDHISTSRQILLINRCSQQYINAYDRQVNARAQATNPFSLMSLETHRVGSTIGISIRSPSGVYVCFNKKAKLVTRWVANLGCLFTEEATDTKHIKYRSMYNPDWYMGFNQKGTPMKGKIRSQNTAPKHPKCYQFMKKWPQKSTQKPIQDSSHEVLHKYDRNIAPINVRPKANGISHAIKPRNSFRVTPKSVLRLIQTSSAPNSNQLIYSFSNYNNFNNYNNRENLSANASINSQKPDIIPNHRLSGRAIDG